MKNSTILFFIAYIFFVITIFAKDSSYYYNSEHKFRIQFPNEWQIKDGIGAHVVKKAVYKGCAIMLSVADIATDPELLNYFMEDENFSNLSESGGIDRIRNEFDSRQLTAIEFESFMKYFTNYFINNVNNDSQKPELLEKKLTYLDNTKFFYIIYNMQTRVLDTKMNSIMMMYFTIRRGKLFIIGCQIPEYRYQLIYPIALKSISTFQFEDWNIELSNNDSFLNNEDDNHSKNNEREIAIYIISGGVLLLFLIGFVIRIIDRKKIEANSSKNSKNTTDEKFTNEDKNINEKIVITKEPTINMEEYQEIDETDLTEEEKERIYCNILGLSGKTHKTEITKAWKETLDKYHPDKVSHLGIEFQIFAEKKTKDINKAYLYFKKKYKL